MHGCNFWIGTTPMNFLRPIFLMRVDARFRDELLARFRRRQSDRWRQDREVLGQRRKASEPQNANVLHDNSSEIGSTPRSTSGIGRPCAPGNSVPGSMPRARKAVAAICPGVVGRSLGAEPISSDDPIT